MSSGREQIAEKVISAVTARTPAGFNHQITSVQQKFLSGSLYTVSFDVTHDNEPVRFVNRVYVHNGHCDVFGFDEQLLAIVGQTHGFGLTTSLSSAKLVTSMIAITVTVLVALYVVVSIYKGQDVPIPQFLSSGFLLILGFYFGKSVEQSKDE